LEPLLIERLMDDVSFSLGAHQGRPSDGETSRLREEAGLPRRRRSARGSGRHWPADTVTPQLTHETSATEAYLDALIALVAAVKIDAGLRAALAG